MRIFVTGSTGLIGSELTPLLEKAGHEVIRLVRTAPRNAHERMWESEGRRLSADVLEGCEVLLHLAGENIAARRWTEFQKAQIYDSRVVKTAILVEAIRKMAAPPKAVICASAIGYYGNRGAEVLTEASGPGTGFLSEVCADWEAALDPIRDRCRIVHVRTGIVLSQRGGALKSMLLPFKLGLGGVVGSGDQYWSWISLRDSARLFQFAIDRGDVSGPLNGVSPEPTTNREFTQTLGRVLNRPTVLPMPAFAAKLALGQMAQDLILASTRVVPEKAQSLGFEFQDRQLEETLRSLKL
jgi:uncharacterized protein (TIGR01777 family)